MNSATDGQGRGGVPGARRCRPRRFSNATKYSCWIVAIGLLSQAGVPAGVAIGPDPSSFVSASVRAFADRAMRILEPPSSRSPGRELTFANRSASIVREYDSIALGRADVQDRTGALSGEADVDGPLAADVIATTLENPSSNTTADSVIRSIRPGEQVSRQIVVVGNESAVIDLAVKIDRARILDADIAEVSVEPPTRVVVSGLETGVTRLFQKLEGVPHPRPEYEDVSRDTLPVDTVALAQAWPTTRLTLRGRLGGLADYAGK